MQEHDAEQQLRTEMQRGEWARQLQENPLLREALDTYETEIVEAWKTSPVRDAEGRERLKLMLDAQKRFRSFLETTATTGKLASTQVQQALTKPSLVGRLWR
jgi:hypothetical protein